MKSYPIREALAAAIYAFDVNDSKVVKETCFKKDVDETNPVGLIENFSNKSIINSYLTRDDKKDLTIPSPPIEVNESHFTRADEIKDYIQHTILMFTLRSSSGAAPDFMSKINELLQKETVSYRDFGILAWAPKVASDFMIKDKVRETTSQFESASNFVGTIGKKVSLTFTLIESKFIGRDINCWMCFGHDECGNLITYWAKDESKIVKDGRIDAKVKSHTINNTRGGSKVTMLNYVKVVS